MTYTMQPFPTLTNNDATDLMNAINQTARIRLQDIANQTNANQTTQNIATTGCIACTATGTNTIALQQNANQTVISGYQNYQQFSFVAAHNSSGNVTVNVNNIGALNLYQSDGATQAGSGVIEAGALYVITYNSALNSATGGLQITSGTSLSGVIVATSIQFGSGAVLNDYEEGAWTPSVGGTATYTQQTGNYRKIGKIVFAQCVVIINAIGTGSTTVISGLPFTAASGSNYNASVGFFSGSATNVAWLTGQVGGSATTITLYSTTAAAAGISANAIFQNGTRVDISVCYASV